MQICPGSGPAAGAALSARALKPPAGARKARLVMRGTSRRRESFIGRKSLTVTETAGKSNAVFDRVIFGPAAPRMPFQFPCSSRFNPRDDHRQLYRRDVRDELLLSAGAGHPDRCAPGDRGLA